MFTDSTDELSPLGLKSKTKVFKFIETANKNHVSDELINSESVQEEKQNIRNKKADSGVKVHMLFTSKK